MPGRLSGRVLNATLGAAMGAALAAFAGAAVAENYPEQPITLVIPYGAGGATDISARALAEPLGRLSPQPMQMINHTGDGGAKGSILVKNAAPDGYTMLFARVGTHSVNPAMKPDLPYALDDFVFVGVYEINPVVCAAGAGSGIDSMDALVAKAKSGSVRFSSSGEGSLPHLAGLMALDSFGVEKLAEAAVHVPRKGGGAAVIAVVTGMADFVCTNSSELVTYVADGQLKPLMVTTPRRLAGFDAPTAAELGHPDLEKLVGWTGLAGPADLPAEVVETWRGWLAAATADEKFVSTMTDLGSVIRLMGPEESTAFVRGQYETFHRLVSTLGIHAE